MTFDKEKSSIISGKTYSLYGKTAETAQYYSIIQDLTNLFLRKCPDKKKLLGHIRHAGGNVPLLKSFSGKNIDKALISYIKKTLKDTLSIYTGNVKQHLKTLPLSQRFDSTLRTKEKQYHLYMVEIELVNRIYKEDFKKSEFKFALIAHCLWDFRPDCRAVPGDIESICKGCTKECFVNLGSLMLKKYNIRPYISVSMDFKKLFNELKAKHPSIGALGIGCIPELANGMRLCIKMGISPVGVPLDANRCSRWMKQCRESSFSLVELEELLK